MGSCCTYTHMHVSNGIILYIHTYTRFYWGITEHTHVYTVLMGSYCTYTHMRVSNGNHIEHIHVYTRVSTVSTDVICTYTRIHGTNGILLYVHTYARF